MSLYRIYSDESRQSKDRFMVLAGIVIPNSLIQDFEATMSVYRAENKMYGELKWSKVSAAKLEVYRAFVDYFFALCDTDKLHFRSVIFDNHKANHKKFNDGNKEQGFYKFYYQLYLLFAREYYKEKEDTRFIIHPDYRQTKVSLNELKDILNNGFKKKFESDKNPYVSIEPLRSKKCDMLQVLDIILGAIGYEKNGYLLLAGSSHAKVELCKYIKDKAGIGNLGKDTTYIQRRFTIWNFPLKK